MVKKPKEKKFDFWQDNSMNFLEMALRTDKIGRLDNPDGYGKNTRECGDTIELFLDIRKGRIASACFVVEGCLNTIACANTVIDMAEGKTAAQAWKISVEKVVDFLETLSPKETHCAELAVRALQLALSDSKKNKRDPWKKMYTKH